MTDAPKGDFADLTWDEEMENVFIKYAQHNKAQKMFNPDLFLLLKKNGRGMNHKEVEDMINRFGTDDHLKLDEFKAMARGINLKITENIEADQ